VSAETRLRVHRHVARSRAVDTGPPPPADLTAELGALELAGPDGVWLIERLEVRAVVAPGTGGSAAARVLALQVVRQLGRVLADGAGRPGVRWFPDRAAFVAQWLVDLCHDRATGRWEYRQFGTLPASAAVRELAAAEPRTVHGALRGLPAADLDDVLDRLAPGDAADVAASIAGAAAGRGGGPAAATERHGRSEAAVAVARALRALLDAGRLPTDPGRTALSGLLALDDPGWVSAATAPLARDLARVLLAIRACGHGRRAELLRALAGGDWRTATEFGGADAVPVLAGLSPVQRAAVVEAFAEPEDAPDGPAAEYSTVGGAFLLLPLLAELPLAAATAGWPPWRDETAVPAAPVVALLAIAGVLGADRAAAILADPWLRLALGLPRTTPGGIARWSTAVTGADAAGLAAAFAPLARRRAQDFTRDAGDPALLQPELLAAPAAEAARLASAALLRELSCRLPGLATASPGHLRRTVLDLDAWLRPEADRIVVELGRPPLGTVLSLTGLNRRSFTLPATGARTWLLTPRS
jgi:hypothetical protein